MGKVAIFDIGGSSIKYSLNELKDFHTQQINNISRELIVEFVAKVCNENGINTICVSAPGVINPQTGDIYSLSKIINWNNFNFKNELIHFLDNKDSKIFIDNDGKCALIGNIKQLDKKINSAISIVFGTGVGGACFLNGKLWRGFTGCAGEFGMSKKNFLQKSCISEDDSTIRLCQDINSKLNTNYDGNKILELFDQGDQQVFDIVNRWMENNALLIFNQAWALDPEVIFIGGGISANPLFQKHLIKYLDKLYQYNNQTYAFKLHFAQDGNYANLLGALELKDN